MDPSLNRSAEEVEQDEWDTDGFVIPSLTIEDSDFANTNVPALTYPIPLETTAKETEKIYLGPHGAPPQAKQQESNATGHKLRSKHKPREAERRSHSGTVRENKIESLQQWQHAKKFTVRLVRTTSP